MRDYLLGGTLGAAGTILLVIGLALIASGCKAAYMKCGSKGDVTGNMAGVHASCEGPFEYSENGSFPPGAPVPAGSTKPTP